MHLPFLPFVTCTERIILALYKSVYYYYYYYYYYPSWRGCGRSIVTHVVCVVPSPLQLSVVSDQPRPVCPRSPHLRRRQSAADIHTKRGGRDRSGTGRRARLGQLVAAESRPRGLLAAGGRHFRLLPPRVQLPGDGSPPGGVLRPGPARPGPSAAGATLRRDVPWLTAG